MLTHYILSAAEVGSAEVSRPQTQASDDGNEPLWCDDHRTHPPLTTLLTSTNLILTTIQW